MWADNIWPAHILDSSIISRLTFLQSQWPSKLHWVTHYKHYLRTACPGFEKHLFQYSRFPLKTLQLNISFHSLKKIRFKLKYARRQVWWAAVVEGHSHLKFTLEVDILHSWEMESWQQVRPFPHLNNETRFSCFYFSLALLFAFVRPSLGLS